MRSPRAWPQRYEVRVHTRAGPIRAYPVVTWLGEEKAIALAVAAHVGFFAEGLSREIADVEIDDQGQVGRTDNGTPALEGADLVDRLEF